MLLLYQKEGLIPMKLAPDFKLPDQDGKFHSLKDYSGKWLVLYFYPKDDTSGCTAEACSFRDERDAVAEYGNATVIGISKDPIASHKKFSEKNKLNFTLLSDESHKVIESYGAWGPRKFMGKEYIGISRNTYLINPSGQIVKEYVGVNPKKHVAEIISDLQSLQAK
jgi:peroxiredoxin Q/BCP